MARMALDSQIDPQLLGGARILALARAVLGEVTAKLPPGSHFRGAVFLALPEARPGFSEAEAKKVVSELATSDLLRGFSVAIGGRGHAGAFEALRMAAESMTTRKAELCIVLGADSYADPDTLEWLDANGQLKPETNRNGFFPGEAAGAVVSPHRRCARPEVTHLARVPRLHRLEHR